MKAAPQTAGVPRLVEETGGRGVRVYAGPRTEPEPEALRRLLEVSKLPWVTAPVVSLPDLHWKQRLETPSSTAVATAGEIVMSFSSPSQNCGMNLLATPLHADDLSDKLLDTLMDHLRELIPRRRRRPTITRNEVIDFCRQGAPAAAARFEVDPARCATMEAGGNTFSRREPSRREIEKALDEQSLDMGRYSFAYIGGGNHFLEL